MAKKRTNNARKESMRLVAYIRAIGAEPLPFDHQSFKAYRADLQRQYQALRSRMGDEEARQARLMGRALVRLRTMEGIAGDIVPVNLSSGKNLPVSGSKPKDHLSQIQAASSSVAEMKEPTSRDVRNCKRKLRHLNFLSALQHVAGLGNPDLHVYPCPVCSGLHVGHDQDRMQLKNLEKELATVEEQLTRLRLKMERLQSHKATLLRLQTALDKALAMDEGN